MYEFSAVKIGGRVSETLEVDLIRAVTKLERQGRYLKLARLVRMFLGASSALTDLEYAAVKLQIMHELAMKDRTAPLLKEIPQDEVEAHIQSSLYDHAVILYARAVGTSPNKGRQHVPILDRFDASDIDASDRILKLRNKGVAHFDKTSDFIDGPISQETAVYRRVSQPILQNSQPLIYFEHVWNRFNYQQNLVQDLGSGLITTM